MNLLIVSASQKTNSQSAKVARYLAETTEHFEQITHLDLCQLNIPFWDGEQSSKEDVTSDWLSVEAQLDSCDAMILITPEWGGTASPLLKNFLLMCDGQQTAHKPALLVSVVDGISGAYPIAELRMNAFKNNKLVAIPDHLIIRNVTEILNNFNNNSQRISDRESRLRQRIGYSLHTLKHYAKTLKNLRTALNNDPFVGEQNYIYSM